MQNPIRIALMISGKGSNAKNVIQQSLKGDCIRVALVVSTQVNAEMSEFCSQTAVAFEHVEPWDITKVKLLVENHRIEVLVLAGFLRKITPELLNLFPDRILNLHPSLLPKYGGKGMYGIHVHRKVIENQEKESGITVHLVNENYDEGRIIAQFCCSLSPEESPESLERKIRLLELQHFPDVVFAYCSALKRC